MHESTGGSFILLTHHMPVPRDGRRSAMRRYLQLILIFAGGFLHSTCVAQESKPKPWLERLAELERELRFDRNRSEPFSCADLSGKPLGAAHEMLSRRLLEEMEKLADQHMTVITPDQRKFANRRLTNLEFEAPAQIEKNDLRQIADYFLQHPILDPRILHIEMKDENTLSITVGVVRGPLAGGGKIYVARRENGKWIVRLDGDWIS